MSSQHRHKVTIAIISISCPLYGKGEFQLEVSIPIPYSLQRSEALNWGLSREQGNCFK